MTDIANIIVPAFFINPNARTDICSSTLRKRGRRYGGNSMRKDESSPFRAVILRSFESAIATAIPIMYIPNIAAPLYCCGKKTGINSTYTGNLAPQLKSGMTIIVAILSTLDFRVRVPIIAGTEHPNPMSIGDYA